MIVTRSAAAAAAQAQKANQQQQYQHPSSSHLHSSNSNPQSQSNLVRSSSFRNMDSAANLTAKSVRWGDSPSTPAPSQRSQLPFTTTSTSTSVSSPSSSTPLFHRSASNPSLNQSTPPPRYQQGSLQNPMHSSQALSQSSLSKSLVSSNAATAATGSTSSFLPIPSRSVSTTSLVRRLRWNGSVLFLIWIVLPLWGKPKQVYWSFLDLVYSSFGGSMDEKVDAIISWISWALSVTLLFNFIEALVLYRRSLTSTDGERLTIAQLQAGAGRSLSTALASPVTARSVGFAQIYGSRGSPKTRPSTSLPEPSSPSTSQTKATQYQNSAPSHDYSVYSPLKRTPSPLKTPITSSPFRRSSSSPFSSSSSPNFERRFPSSSPLSAYRARNLSSSRSSPFSKLGSVPGLEGEDGEIDVGEESFEVDRALRSLSDNFSQVIGDKSNNPGVAARSGA